LYEINFKGGRERRWGGGGAQKRGNGRGPEGRNIGGERRQENGRNGASPIREDLNVFQTSVPGG